MAASFPTSLAAIQRVSATDLRNAPGKEGDVLHNKLCDEVEALQAKVGVDGSAVPTTIDARLTDCVAAIPAAIQDHVAESDPHPAYMLSANHAAEHAALAAKPTDRVIAHRGGGALVNAEYTMSAYQYSIAAGIKNIEFDVHVNAAGMALLMHDPTVDRTTTATGNVADLTNDAYAALVCDTDVVLGAPNYRRESPPFFIDALRHVLSYPDTVAWIEAKNAGADIAILDALHSLNVDRKRVVIASSSSTYLTKAIAQGFKTSYQAVISGSPDWQTLAASGYTYIAGSYTDWTSQKVADCHTAGMGAVAYTPNRRHEYQQLIGYGIDFVYSDDPMWCCSAVTPIKNSLFASGRWTNGMLSYASRGGFGATLGEWGYSTTSAAYQCCLQGWACPIKNNENCQEFTITLQFKFTDVSDVTRWFSLFVCANTDKVYTNGSTADPNGYHLLIKKNGNLDIWRKSDGVSPVLVYSLTGGAEFVTDTYYGLTITVTATQISLAIPSLSRINTVTDANHRGGYFSIGRTGAAVMIKDVVIS